MKTLMIAGALALAGLSFAGSAAAECASTPLGLFDYDNLNVCVLETDTYGYPPYYEQTFTQFANANLYGYNFSPYEYSSVYGQVYQYSGEQCWGCGGNPDTYGGMGANVGLYRYTPSEYANAGVYVYQYNYDGNFYDYANTGAGVYYSAGGEYASLYYNQNTYNGNCNEQLAMYDSGSGYTEIIPYGPCMLEIPQVPALPSL